MGAFLFLSVENSVREENASVSHHIALGNVGIFSPSMLFASLRKLDFADMI